MPSFNTIKVRMMRKRKNWEKDAIRIALQAKIKKKLMYSKKEEDLSFQIKTLNKLKEELKYLLSQRSKQGGGDALNLIDEKEYNIEIEKMEKTKELKMKTEGNESGAEQIQKLGLKSVRSGKAGDAKIGSGTGGGYFFLTEQKSTERFYTNPDEGNKSLTLPKIDPKNLSSSKVLQKNITEIKLYQPEKNSSKISKTLHPSYILPKIKQSILDHTSKEMSVIQEQTEDLRKEYDNIVTRK